MGLKKNTEIVFKWIEAFNEHDIEKLLALYDKDASHFSPRLKKQHPKTKGKIKGKKALRKWWEEAFEKLPTLQYKLTMVVVFKDTISIVYERKVKKEKTQEVGEVLTFKNGLIIKSAVVDITDK